MASRVVSKIFKSAAKAGKSIASEVGKSAPNIYTNAIGSTPHTVARPLYPRGAVPAKVDVAPFLPLKETPSLICKCDAIKKSGVYYHNCYECLPYGMVLRSFDEKTLGVNGGAGHANAAKISRKGRRTRRRRTLSRKMK